MSEFYGLLFIVFIISMISSVISAAKKASGKARQSSPGAAQAGRKPDAKAPAAPAEGPREAPRVMQPTVSFSGHDDSVYAGSLNAVTGEGYDPCHDEQMAPLTAIALEEAPAAAPAPAGAPLGLSFTGGEMARAFVMSEILNRRR